MFGRRNDKLWMTEGSAPSAEHPQLTDSSTGSSAGPSAGSSTGKTDDGRRPASRRHGRRPIRSAITGPGLLDPNGRVLKFRRWAGAVIQYLQAHFPSELEGVSLGFATMPILPRPKHSTSTKPMYYDVDREAQTIVLYRMPIQRFRGLHANDEDHRRMFVEHCVYQAVCEYLEVDPWDLLPGRFEHY